MWAARLFALACAALGVVEVCASAPLPGLHLWPWTNEIVAWISGALLLAGAFWLLRRPRGKAGGWPLTALWSVAFVFAIAAAGQTPRDPTGWVAVAETLVLAAAAWAAPSDVGREPHVTLAVVFGGAVILFGAVHLLFVHAIAALVPSWMPARSLWPWLTGAAQVVLGAACLWRRIARYAALGVAALFASWIVLVHAGRLVAQPTDAFEWTFALTAVALIAAALLVATSCVAAPGPVQRR